MISAAIARLEPCGRLCAVNLSLRICGGAAADFANMQARGFRCVSSEFVDVA